MSTINRADQRSDRLHAGWRLGSDGLRLPWLDRHFCTRRAALLLLATFGMQGATSVWNAPFAATSGLNRPGPPPGRPIAPPISRVFRFLCVCIPTGAASVAKSGFFLEFWCCVHNSPDFKHTIPGLHSLHNPRILCTSWDCGTLWVLFRTSLAILGLDYTKPHHPKALAIPGLQGCNPNPRFLQSQEKAVSTSTTCPCILSGEVQK
jgi:hypothetical protein